MDMMSNLLRDLESLSLAQKSSVIAKPAGDDYIVDISVQSSRGSTSSSPMIAAASSNFSIHLLSKGNLQPISTIKGHTDTITKVQFCKSNSDLLYSSSKDKTLRCWDSRTSKQTQCFKTPASMNVDLLSMDVSQSGRLLCAGTESVKKESYLLFWDSRLPKVLGCYCECHQDDITQLSFQPGSDKYLASGSSDGLVCTFDLSETCEDDSLQTTANAESDVARVSWCGADSSCVYAVTTDNMFYVWDSLEGDSLSCIESLEQVQGSSKSSSVDYILDCLPSLTAVEDGRSSAVLLTGTYSGNANIIWHENEKDTKTICSLSGGHSAPLRCSHWDAESRTLLTGAEDSVICLWSLEQSGASPDTDNTKTEPQGKMRKRTSLSSSGKRPYDKPKRL
ncbi:hypothetical protein EGW08_005192 [Elysia chlorotica]|uniref:WD repeat-containing protein 89 n=1 Tax=Elysia chlorotica TaxID=188477 RepID=A0A433TZN3_ELYCH|nr:hypothetical protein EGW08_005192 [Elysia chlorotica]